jgi:hypothetical protein
MKVITRDLPSDYFTANKFREGDQTKLKFLLAVDRHGNEVFVIWGPGMVAPLHKEKFDYFGFERAISAGYIRYESDRYDGDPGEWLCWGESTSLHLRARKEDTEILQGWIDAERKNRDSD